MAKAIGNSGLIFMTKNNDREESKFIINNILPGHKFSYNDGPFIIGYTSIKKNNNGNDIIDKKSQLVIDLSGMSNNCLSNYLQDIEQAISREKINDHNTRKKWKESSIVCEIAGVQSNEYRFNIEQVWKYIRGLINN